MECSWVRQLAVSNIPLVGDNTVPCRSGSVHDRRSRLYRVHPGPRQLKVDNQGLRPLYTCHIASKLTRQHPPREGPYGKKMIRCVRIGKEQQKREERRRDVRHGRSVLIAVGLAFHQRVVKVDLFPHCRQETVAVLCCYANDGYLGCIGLARDIAESKCPAEKVVFIVYNNGADCTTPFTIEGLVNKGNFSKIGDLHGKLSKPPDN
jgi:hypothetical protein